MLLCCTLLLAALALPAAAQAVTVVESGDAGSLPSSAQAVAGVPTLITGSVNPVGDEDMYRVCLTGNRTFSATTQGSELGDPQLFLFDSQGRGVYGNDDFFDLQSNLAAGTGFTPTSGGTYYLAISSFDNQPVSEGGEIFFYTQGSFPFLVPEGPGGGSPVTGWDDSFFAGSAGTYRITLTGTRACLPASKEECKNGGWRNFGVFKNQGDCVSFVSTGGRDEPTGPEP
jgi:hypothetical protein